MPAKFAQVFPNSGVDDAASPNPWIMVPESGYNLVMLKDGAPLTLRHNNKVDVHEMVDTRSVAKLPLAGFIATAAATAIVITALQLAKAAGARLFAVVGNGTGNGTIDAVDGGNTKQASLDFSVKALKTVKVSFNFVEDSGGHKTSRNTSQAAAMLTTLNNIMWPQANVRFVQQSVRKVTAGADLGTVVRFSSHLPGVPASEHEWDDIIALGDSGANLNVFFVWEYEQDATPRNDHTGGAHLNGNILLEDSISGPIARNLAHESGHYLGMGDFYAASEMGWLMYGKGATRGEKIPKAHANTMNP